MQKSWAWPVFHVFVTVFTLASCGFSPVYAPGSDSAAALSEISVAAPSSRSSYLFVREMEQRLGQPTSPTSVLKYKISLNSEGDQAESKRIRLVGVVRYKLVEIASDRVLFSGAVESFAGYSTINNLADSARQDALDRLIVTLSDQLFRELIIKISSK